MKKRLVLFFLFLFIFTFSAFAQNWFKGELDDVFAKAKKEGKMVLLYFAGTEGCVGETCRLLDQQFFQEKKHHEFLNNNFILYRVTQGEKIGEEVFKRFRVIFSPLVLVMDLDGTEIDRYRMDCYRPVFPDKFFKDLGKTLKGIDTFKSLSERYDKNPKNAEVVFKLARKYESMLERGKAFKLYKEFMAIAPEGEMGTIDVEGGKATYTEYAELFVTQDALRSGSSSKEKDPGPIKAFIKKYPESELLKQAYNFLARYYKFAGSKEEATAFFEEYVSKYPEDPHVLRSYTARIIRDKDNIDKGLELAEKVKDIMKYNPDFLTMKDLAKLHMLKGDERKAEEVFGKNFVERKASTLAYNLIQYADFWIKQNTNIESAEEMVDLGVRMNSEEWRLIRKAAQIYIGLKKPEKALKICGPEFIKKYMNDAKVKRSSYILTSYAQFWTDQGENLDSALEAAKKAIELPSRGFTWGILSNVYFKMKKYDEALKAAEKAVELADERIKIKYERLLTKRIKEAMAKEKK